MKKLLKNPVVIIIILIVLVFIGSDIYNRIILGDDYGKDYNITTHSHWLSNDEAVIASQKFVESRLKSPKTAEFQPLFKAKVERVNDVYTIISYVDSQNSFGATIRSNYMVKLKQKTNGDISLIEIKIE